MAIGQNRVIHRFIRSISEYEEGGSYFNQVIPIDTQAYAYYPADNEKFGLWYVFGDGLHTYTEIRDGKGTTETANEYKVFTEDDAGGLKLIHVTELPEVGEPDVIYLVPCSDKYKTDANHYEEWVFFNEEWELIGGSGSVTPDDLVAENIKYEWGSIDTVKKALDVLLSYQPTIEPGEDEVTEIGSTVKDVTLTWDINKPLVSITIEPGNIEVDPTAKSYTIENANLTEDTTYTIIFNDGKNEYTTEQKVQFLHKVYNGTSATADITDAEIITFDQEYETSDIIKSDYTFNCSGGKYFFICVPTAKADNATFKINGFTFTDMVREDKSFTNASGYTSEYTIFRVNNLQHGSNINVEIIYE